MMQSSLNPKNTCIIRCTNMAQNNRVPLYFGSSMQNAQHIKKQSMIKTGSQAQI